jgi:adenosylcobinamide-GDP ribazoletransferase
MNSLLRDLNGALSLLTTLPTPRAFPDEPGRAFAYFPLVGALLGGLLWGVYGVLARVFPPDAAAFGVLVAWVLLTGGLHLDGFGDACDGLFVAADPARRLEIMKDARAGSWAVIGLVLLLLGKWVALRSAPPAALVLAAVTGRWVMVIAAVSIPYARQTGMGGYFRAGLGRAQVLIASVTWAAVLLLYSAWWVPVVGTLVIVAAAAWWGARRLGGGLTGDLYGALCELTELLVLFVLNLL